MEIDRIPISEELIRPQMLTLREFRPFKSSDEYLWAMKEDLSDWLNLLYPQLNITPHTFMECLETGVVLCKHANNVKCACSEWLRAGRKLPKCWGRDWKLPTGEVIYNSHARPETFFSRDNVHNFIQWCRRLGIFECLLFESDDLILRKNEKNVILCLLEVARRGSHFGMAAPLLVQFEKEIDRDIAKDAGIDLSSSSGEEEESYIQEYGPTPQIITNDLRSLDEMVRDLVERCTCPTQFQMIRVAEGKYRIGNTKTLIYVRILKNHCMIRVGGGWDTLEHFLQKHDPCKCSSGHRQAISSKFTIKNNEGKTPKMRVEYERRDDYDSEGVSPPSSYPNLTSAKKKPPTDSDSSSEISDEGYRTDGLNLKGLVGTTPKNDGVIRSSNGKTPLVRAHSLSTDEDRPDSRSTDEEMGVIGPKAPRSVKDRGITKSSSTSRVPRTYNLTYNLNGHPVRSNSSDRPWALDTSTSHRSHGSSRGTQSTPSTPLHGSIKSPSNPLNNGVGGKNFRSKTHEKVMGPPPIRSRSAGGSVDFFANSKRTSTGSSRTPSRTPHLPRSGTLVHSTPPSGKNTWNGSTAIGYQGGGGFQSNRVRPDLFQVKFQNSYQTEPDVGDNIVKSVGSSEISGLAGWIKRALELDSNEDKISHIEMAIKEFEQRDGGGGGDGDGGGGGKGPSNPFDSMSSVGSSPSSITTPIRKRKETGTTRIPKPNFY